MSTPIFCFAARFKIIADGADNDGAEAENLAYRAADGNIHDVVGQPAGGADEAKFTDRSGVLQAEAHRCSSHTDHRQQLNDTAFQRKRRAEHGKGEDVREDIQRGEQNQPEHSVGAEFLPVGVHNGTHDAHDIHAHSHQCAHQQVVEREQNGAKELERNDPLGRFLLKGQNIKGHGNDANGLRDPFKFCHIFLSLSAPGAVKRSLNRLFQQQRVFFAKIQSIYNFTTPQASTSLSIFHPALAGEVDGRQNDSLLILSFIYLL